MSPFKSIKGRALGKLLEGYKSSDIGKGFGSGGAGGGSSLDPVAVPSVLATGGNVELIGNLVRHTFTSPGTFLTGDSHPGTIEYIILAGGGGGGGAHHGGGGGSGGLIYHPSASVNTNNSYPITVGEGGQGGKGKIDSDNNPGLGGQGGNSSGFGSTARGGGGGGSSNPGQPAGFQRGGSLSLIHI